MAGRRHGDPLASTYYVMAANVVVLVAALASRTSDATEGAWDAAVELRSLARKEVAARFRFDLVLDRLPAQKGRFNQS